MPPTPPPSNPFAAARLRPGGAEYLWSVGFTAEGCVAALRQAGWWGEIIGPHGCGKSSLLAALEEPLRAAGRRLVIFRLHAGERRLPPHEAASWSAETQVIVDGCEQLGWLARRGLWRAVRRRGAGLLITAHRSLGLARVPLPPADLAQAQAVAAMLQAETEPLVAPADVAAAFRRHGANLREMLFELYDLYERRARQAAAPRPHSGGNSAENRPARQGFA